MFEPCYIGGWSACEHWDLTEQIFRDVVVVTGTPIRSTRASIQGTPFRLKFLARGKHFGTRTVWRGQGKVLVSDPSRTVVDILDDPSLGGGIRHVAQILRAYFQSAARDESLLVQYAVRLGNRSVLKRLGYLLEKEGIEAAELIERCHALRSSGLTALDPTSKTKGRILRRWNLRVNVAIQSAELG